MELKKSAIVLNGFIHDFAAGYWLAAIVAITVLHREHGGRPEVIGIISGIEHLFFWQSVVAMLLILATGAGRTFTYVENWYGEDAEKVRRRMEELLFDILVAIGSVLAGIIGALIGLGGGVIITPLLVLGFGVDIRFEDLVRAE